LEYRVVGGNLPSGLDLSTTGNVVGKVKQYGDIRYRSVWRQSREYTVNDVVKINLSASSYKFYKCTADHVSGPSFQIEYWVEYNLASSTDGLTTIDGGRLTLDGRTTSVDREFKFSVIAQDQFQYSAIVGTFKLAVDATDPVNYSNIYVKPYQSLEKRNLFSGFINDTNIFTPDRIYRAGDPSFGMQTELKMLLYPGIETIEAKYYALALTKNAKKKRFRLGEVKKAIAKTLGTNDVIYEVIYLDVLDDQEKGKLSAPRAVRTNINNKIKINQDFFDNARGNLSNTDNQLKLLDPAPNKFRLINDTIKVNNNAVTVGNMSYYPTSVSNIRKNLSEIEKLENDGSTETGILTENEFLPLWMLTPQNKFTAATGFINAVPLCYCIPGGADYIIENIKNSDFDFTFIDYEIDRLIIDTVVGNSSESYLKFPNYQFNV
jgi:hypothetical protein